MSMPSSSELVATMPRSSPRLERLLDLAALRRARGCRGARAPAPRPAQLVEPLREPLAEPAAVHEHDRRAVRADRVEQLRIDRRPDADAGSGARAASSPRIEPDGRHRRRIAAAPPRARRARRAASCPATGTQICRSSCGGALASTIVDRRDRRRGSARPRRAAARSPTGRCAADRARRSAASRSSESARCAPRLVGASAWISSTITVSTLRSVSRAREPSSRYSDSGVVTRISAGSRACARALLGRRVAGAHARRAACAQRRAEPLGRARDAGERRAQVALDVVDQRLERRDIEHAHARGRRGSRRARQPVDAPRGTRPASCRCRSARSAARARRARCAAQPRACTGGRRARTPARTTARRGAEAIHAGSMVALATRSTHCQPTKVEPPKTPKTPRCRRRQTTSFPWASSAAGVFGVCGG